MEVIISDDASTDETRKILSEYVEKYPGFFKLLLPEKNQGMNICTEEARRIAQGRYLAILEGDDFWTDPRKLQTQLDFLDSHPEYSGCCHRFRFVDRFGQVCAGFTFKRFFSGDIYTIKEAEAGFLPSQTSTLMYRNFFYENEPLRQAYLQCDSIGDMKIALTIVLFGPVYCFPEFMGVYRYVTSGGFSWSATTKEQNLSLTYEYWREERIRYARETFGVILHYREMARDIVYHAYVLMLKKPTKNNRKVFWELFSKQPQKAFTIIFLLRKTIGFPLRKIINRKGR